MFTYLALVSPPIALAIDVFARSLAEIGRADDQDLEALRPGLVASPRAGRDAHRVPFLQLDDLVVELHPAGPAHDHVHLLLRLVRVAVRKAIAGRDAPTATGTLYRQPHLTSLGVPVSSPGVGLHEVPGRTSVTICCQGRWHSRSSAETRSSRALRPSSTGVLDRRRWCSKGRRGSGSRRSGLRASKPPVNL